VAVDQEKALGLLFRAMTPGACDPAEDLVLRLREIRDAKGCVLTDDEYEEWRQGVIKQIVSRAPTPWPFRIALPLLLVGCIVLASWGVARSDNGMIIGGVLAGIMCAALWRGIERDCASKRDLSPSSRLAIVDRLLQEQLITEAEAAKYREQIEAI
jgi:hypothetical protein